jgi:DNA-directed RNA polymerase subunit RPC12/RpoP
MARRRNTQGLATMVCVTCGAEQFFDKQIPSALTCTKCGGTVFRQFMTPTDPDEATISQLEEQARSIQYGDPSPDTSPDELRDLESQ